MNDFELFLNFGAVVKIRRHYRDDLYKFVKLMLLLGFMRENINWFIFSNNIVEIYRNGKKLDKEQLLETIKLMTKEELLGELEESFCDSGFWHLVDINEGMANNICIEYQASKGFTFGTENDYVNYDDTIKVLGIDELILACDMGSNFNLGYTETTFKTELEEKDNELAKELDYFCEFYDWTIVKYPNGLWNVLDTQKDEFVGYFNRDDENGTFREVMERVFYRMVDYFQDEEDIDGLIEEESFDYLKSKINTFIRLGKQYKFYNDSEISRLEELLKEIEDEEKEVEEN